MDPKKYWDARLKKYCNLRGVGYISGDEYFNKYLYKAKVRTLERVIRKFNISFENKEILDVGSGIGFWIDYYLSKNAPLIWGVDISSEAIRYLSKKYADQNRVKLSEDDFSNLSLNKKFDIVNAFDVSYHVCDDTLWNKFVENLCKHVKEFGFIFISDTFREDYRSDIVHVKFRPLIAYERIFRKYGIQIISLIPMYSILGGPFTGRQKIDRLLWIIHTLFVFASRCKLLANFLYFIDSLLIHLKPFGISTKLLVVQKT
jgi:2-polyprenyl-3-methyl-5-hydroxy-6-metoxy-1,4-benzoquinol methylase